MRRSRLFRSPLLLQRPPILHVVDCIFGADQPNGHGIEAQDPDRQSSSIRDGSGGRSGMAPPAQARS
jgi:hypothetical protein